MREVKTIWARTQEERVVADIKEAISKGEVVILHNEHETFYGMGFGHWYEEQLKGTPCTIEVTERDRMYGFERTMIIRPSAKRK